MSEVDWDGLRTAAIEIMPGVLSAFLMLGRSGVNLAGYSVAESEMRRGLEEFSQVIEQ